MKWTVKLIAETRPGESVEHEVASIEGAEVVSSATAGLTIAEGKTILESLQQQMIVAQIEHHGASISACPRCGRRLRTKGYYRSTLRSVYGNVRIRVRRIKGCLYHSISKNVLNRSSGAPIADTPRALAACGGRRVGRASLARPNLLTVEATGYNFLLNACTNTPPDVEAYIQRKLIRMPDSDNRPNDRTLLAGQVGATGLSL